MNKKISEKIAEMIKAAKSKRNTFVSYVNSDLQSERSLSLSYPEGETAYFKKKIFDLKLQINDQSLIGKDWIRGYCQPDIFNSDWIQLHTEILLKPEYKFDENEAFRQIKLFLDQFVQLSHYENIVKENESKPDNKPSTAVWAYYYHILHSIDPSKNFEFASEGTEKAMKKIAKEKKISWKSFQQQYLKLNASKQSKNTITTKGKIPTIKKVIELLKDNPEGEKLAKEYLNIAMGNK